MHSNLVLHLFDYVNAVILTYFVIANVMYSILMVISLYAVSVHSKFAAHTSYEDIMDSPVTPPVALLVPAFNEQDVIVSTVEALMDLRYPEKEIIVIDDGSTDQSLDRLIARFGLKRMDLIYRPVIKASTPYAFFHNPELPDLLVIAKPNGGKSDALNVGINMARSPYFCTVDADSIVERDALLRLIAPIVHSNVNTIVSGGVVRIANGCSVERGKVTEIALPKTWLERCQVVEYIRTFLFGRPGWNFLNANFICSGAFCLLQKEAVVLSGGFGTDTVTEDIDMIATLHQFMRAKGWKYRMTFTTDPVCWTECPKSFDMLARQRRRWQLGLMQTVMKHDKMIFSYKHGMLGMISMPFHAFIEAVGCVVEAAGLIILPLSFFVGAMPFALFLMLMFLAFGYGTLLSIASVLLAEATVRRYPKYSDMLTLMLYALLENFGYRQLISFFRAQGVFRYIRGAQKWEVVTHGQAVEVADAQA
jgi:cellulose synthase/poly-beta-1,6-N-acetylglucosamine synthase-like glycosyltransferase